MKKNLWQTWLSLIVCVVLTAAMALNMSGCANNPTGGEETPQTNAGTDAGAVTVMGEGDTVFPFTVKMPDGSETVYEIHTNEKTVGAALLALDLIGGEEGPYGIYVKTVGGVTLDYDKDGKYWAFYVDGAYAMSGVDVTDITSGATYAFCAENA